MDVEELKRRAIEEADGLREEMIALSRDLHENPELSGQEFESVRRICEVLERHGFQVETRDLQNLDELKASNGVPRPLRSCHTALVDGYVIEGHVPAADVQRLLRERPRVAGLAVPGMPIGSPGMEGPNPDPYQVWSFGGAEGVVVFSSHAPR